MEIVPLYVPYIFFGLSLTILVGVGVYVLIKLNQAGTANKRILSQIREYKQSATSLSEPSNSAAGMAYHVSRGRQVAQASQASLAQPKTDYERVALQPPPIAKFGQSVPSVPKPQPDDKRALQAQAPLSPAERKFYDFLDKTIDNRYIIQTKIPLSDLFKQDRRLEYELYTMRRYGHVDYVLLDKKTKDPILAIELDDWHHKRPERQARDRRKNSIFQIGEVKLLRFQVGKRWGDKERKAILEALP